MNHDFIDILHDRLSQHEMAEPSGLWQEIDNSLGSSLNEKKGLVASRRNLIRAIAGAAAIALVAVVMWTALSDGSNTPSQGTSTVSHANEQFAQAHTSPNPITQDDSSPHEKGSVKSPSHKPQASVTAPQYQSQSHSNISNLSGTASQVEEDMIAQNQEIEHSPSTREEPAATRPQEMTRAETAQLTTDSLSEPVDTTMIIINEPAPPLQQLWAVTEPTRNKQPKLEFTLSYNGNLASAGSSGDNVFSDSSPVSVPENSSPDPEEPHNQETAIVKEKEQMVPVRVGLEAWYPINEKWRVGSGLVYTRMTRKMTTTYTGPDKSTWSKKTETASYLGIPLEVSRILWNRRRWALYASAGAMIEFNLKSESRQETQTELYNKKDFRDRRPQFSAIARLGLQYNVADRVGLFLEPGASYYFHNGADDNLYIKHPFRFDISLGIKLNLGK